MTMIALAAIVVISGVMYKIPTETITRSPAALPPVIDNHSPCDNRQGCAGRRDGNQEALNGFITVAALR
jgi:hypothetical protein